MISRPLQSRRRYADARGDLELLERVMDLALGVAIMTYRLTGASAFGFSLNWEKAQLLVTKR